MMGLGLRPNPLKTGLCCSGKAFGLDRGLGAQRFVKPSEFCLCCDGVHGVSFAAQGSGGGGGG